MPIGIMIDSLAVVLGGVLGTFAGKKLSTEFKETLNMMFGISCMTMGISSICLMQNMPAVVFSTIIGAILGLVLHLGERVEKAGYGMQRIISRVVKTENSQVSQAEFSTIMVTWIVISCASGTGLYGSMISGINGDHSVMITKSILDLFTALIFACSVGLTASVVAVPQFFIFLTLFFAAKLIVPLTTPAMINDFKACGGLIMLATGFRLAKIKMFPIADMVPAMILVMPVSWAWVTYILPLVS